MSSLESLLIGSLLAPVAGAALTFIAPARLRGTVFLAVTAVECLLALGISASVLVGDAHPQLELWPLASLGRPVLVLDPLAALFALVTSLVFLVGAVYTAGEAGRYDGGRRPAVFMTLYQLLLGAILVLLAAGDVLSFLIGWEVMGLLLYALVVFDRREEPTPRAAYLMLATGEAGMLAGAMGLLLLAAQAPDLGFTSLRIAGAGLDESLTWAVFLLSFFGFGVKAGIFPVNQWLPDAYTFAPRGFRPILAGASTNLGIYAITRIGFDLLSPSIAGPGLVALVVGSLTALIGILYASIQADIRRMLAHSSIENMGIVVAALGAGLVFAAEGFKVVAAIALVAALYHMTNHAFYKALLFIGAGSVEEVASSDMDRLGGLLRRMPVTGFLFLIGILAISALPPLNGFVSEWLMLETMLRAAVLSSTVVKVSFALSGAALALTAGLAVTCFVKAFAMSFLGMCRSREAAMAHEAPRWARSPMAAFALACVLLGVLPTYAIGAFDRVIAPMIGQSPSQALVPPFFVADESPTAPLPPAFRKEFHELGAEVGTAILPGRGLVVLHRGGEKNPVVFAMSTSYMIVVLATLLLIAYAGFRLLTRRRVASPAPVWDGGLRQLRPEHTYTATGFSNPVRVVFHAILRPRTLEDSTAAVAEHFRMVVRRVVVDAHLADRLFLQPLIVLTGGLARIMRRMHHGQVNAYAAYVLLTLLVSLVIRFATLE
jgi:hydrogenase-4 component B